MDQFQILSFGQDDNFQFCRITHIPYQMISSQNKQHVEDIVEGTCQNTPTAHCTARSFERLPGYVDIDLLSMNSLNSILDQPRKIAAVVCKIKPANENQLQMYQMMLQSQNFAVIAQIQERIDTLKGLAISQPPDSAELADLTNYVSGLDSSEQEIVSTLEREQEKLDGMPEEKARLLAAFEECRQNLDKVKRGMATTIRVKTMQSRR